MNLGGDPREDIWDPTKIAKVRFSTSRQFHQHFTYERRFGSFSLVTFWLWGEIRTKNLQVKL